MNSAYIDWENEVVLITGASSGLGRAIALHAAGKGAIVIGIARNPQALSDTFEEIRSAGGRGRFYSFDLNDVEGIPRLCETVVSETGSSISVLINNVGYQTAGFVQNTPVEAYLRNYRVNVLAPVALIQCVLPAMLRRQKGTIANVMSSIMYHSFPGVSSYAASKKSLGAIHESLKLELSGMPINVMSIRPGSFRSNYWKNTEVEGRLGEYKLPDGTQSSGDPAHVARIVCEGIEKGCDKIDLSTLKDKVGYHLSYWAPRVLEKIITSKNSRLIGNGPKS